MRSTLMKRAVILVLCLSLFAFAGRRSRKKAEPVMASPQDTFSYAIGLDIARNLEQIESELNLDFLILGIKDGSDDSIAAKISEEDAKAIIELVFKKLQEQAVAKQDSIATATLAKGIAFLEENAKKEGVTVTESGLQYEVIAEGEGAMPSLMSQVKVHYVGTTLDGKVFDSSRERNSPATFDINRVIKGWTEAVQLMSEGSIFKVYIPSNLAYGERGAGQDIGPNEVLVFEIELLEVLSNPANLGDVEEPAEVSEEPTEESKETKEVTEEK